MSEIQRRAVVLIDACVLYRQILRDLLLNLALQKLYLPKWSPGIQNEWVKTYFQKYPEADKAIPLLIVERMNTKFPDAEVVGYASDIEKYSLPDKNVRHVLAAAVKAEAVIILTFNLKGFPISDLSKFEINPLSPDDFCEQLIVQHPNKFSEAFLGHLNMYQNPRLSVHELLERYTNNGIPNTASRLRKLVS